MATLFLAWRVAVVGALEAHFGSGFDDRRFDKLETEWPLVGPIPDLDRENEQWQ